MMKLSFNDWWVGIYWTHGYQADFIHIGFLPVQIHLRIERTFYWEIHTEKPIHKLELLIAKLCGVSPHQASNYTGLNFESRAQAEHFSWLINTWGLNTVKDIDEDDIPF